jgi:DNA-binding response OmpR family regulator
MWAQYGLAKRSGGGAVQSETGSEASRLPGRGQRILVVDDEDRILDFIARGLRQEGYEVDVAADGREGLDAALANQYELVILDLLMPGLPGITVLDRILQRKPFQSVLVLSCLTDTTTKVQCLGLGADDYVAKPVSFDELLLRVRARIRSSYGASKTLELGHLKLDVIRRWVQAGGRAVALTEREFLLLRELMRHPGETMTKDDLLASVWGYGFDPGSNVVDVYVRRLRAKLGMEVITTVRGEGYRISPA